MKLSSWPEIGSDGDVLLTPYVPKGITGYDDDDFACSAKGTEIVLSCFLLSQFACNTATTKREFKITFPFTVSFTLCFTFMFINSLLHN